MATNRGLRRAYTIWATIYDPMTRLLRASRRRSIGLLDLRPWDSVLLVGCGTGADFEFLPREAQCVGVDLTPAMLRRAAAKVGDRRIRLEEMDAMDLRFPDATFDKTILHHILAVVPDPVRTLPRSRTGDQTRRAPGGLGQILEPWPPPPVPASSRQRGFREVRYDGGSEFPHDPGPDIPGGPAGSPHGIRRALPCVSAEKVGFSRRISPTLGVQFHDPPRIAGGLLASRTPGNWKRPALHCVYWMPAPPAGVGGRGGEEDVHANL